jgi:hypothetical protein
MKPKGIRVVAVLLALLAAASTAALSKRPFPEDTFRCKDFVCTSACGDAPYINGVCKDGNQYSAITIECCCCVPGANNRSWIGG